MYSKNQLSINFRERIETATADVRVHLWKIESMEEEEEEELKHRGLENMVRDGWTAGRMAVSKKNSI